MAAGGSGGRYIVDMVWTSHGGQVLATMGQIQSGMRGVGTTAGMSERNLAGWNRQMSAIQTTLRYFVSGGLIYGAVNAFRQYSQFQSQLGDISAISPDLSRNAITGIGDRLLQQSTALATPVGELEDSARNIQSTLQGLKPDEITHFTEMFAQGARIAESDAYNFGNSIMGMRNAFDLSLTDMQRISGEFFTVISQSAGMTGDEWAKFSGRVVAGAKQAGASLEEMNALMILMTRQGGTAATNARHFAQFLMQLRNPTQEAEPFWESIGLSRKNLQTMPFDAIMAKLNNAIQSRGGISAAKMSDDALAMAEELGPDATPSQMGIGGGATTLLMNLFGRMESRRAASVIFSQINQPDRPGNLGFQSLLTNLQDSKKQIDANNQAMERWLGRNRIQQAGIALRNLLTESINPFERQISGIASKIADIAGSDAAPKVGTAAIAAGGAYTLYRVLRGVGVAGTVFSRFLRGTAGGALAVAQGAAPPTGSFSNPFWVMIHPLSGAGGIGKGTIPTTGPILPGGRAGESPLARGGRLAGLAAAIGPYAPFAGIVALGASLGPTEGGRYNPGLAMAAHRRQMTGVGSGIGGGAGGFWRQVTQGFTQSGLAGAAAEKVQIAVDISPEARRLLDINVSQGTPRKRTHVPVGHSAWRGGASPQFRGSNDVPRGGL